MAETQLRVAFKGVDRTAKTVDKVGKRIKSMALKAGAALAGAFAIRRISQFGRESISLFQAQDQAEKKLGATLNATAGAAGRTFKELKAAAGQLQSMTNFGDEVIINGQAILATFKNIKGDAFDDATTAMLDMSAVMDTDLKSSAVLLGKALNDPEKGLSALTRVGVTFTDQQKKAIKEAARLGDTLGAQRVILAELKGEFGGVAAAMADPLKQIENSWNDVKEGIGQTIVELIEFSGLGESLKGLLDGLSGKFGNMSVAIFTWAQNVKTLFKIMTVGVEIVADAVGRLSVALDTLEFEEAFEGFEGISKRLDRFARENREAIEAFKAKKIEKEAKKATKAFGGAEDAIKAVAGAIRGIKGELSDFVLAGTAKAIARQFARVMPQQGQLAGRGMGLPAVAGIRGGGGEFRAILEKIAVNTKATAKGVKAIEFEEV